MQADKKNKLEFKISDHRVDYLDAIAIMDQRVIDIQNFNNSELVWFLEHDNVYTAGTSSSMADILNHDRCPIYETGRGGQITYHGPGQRVVYVMIDLKTREPDLRKYVHNLEQWIINSLLTIDIQSSRREGRIGIWVDTPSGDKKIASIGVRVKKWVTMHGIAININPDLSFFDDIIPCGISAYGVTSASQILNKSMDVKCLDHVLQKEFYNIFQSHH